MHQLYNTCNCEVQNYLPLFFSHMTTTRMTQQDYCNPDVATDADFDGFCVKWEGIVQLGAWYFIKGKYMCQNNDINFIATLGTTWSCDRWHRHLLVTN